jgi:hypothetical protein
MTNCNILINGETDDRGTNCSVGDDGLVRDADGNDLSDLLSSRATVILQFEAISDDLADLLEKAGWTIECIGIPCDVVVGGFPALGIPGAITKGRAFDQLVGVVNAQNENLWSLNCAKLPVELVLRPTNGWTDAITTVATELSAAGWHVTVK